MRVPKNELYTLRRSGWHSGCRSVEFNPPKFTDQLFSSFPFISKLFDAVIGLLYFERLAQYVLGARKNWKVED